MASGRTGRRIFWGLKGLACLLWIMYRCYWRGDESFCSPPERSDRFWSQHSALALLSRGWRWQSLTAVYCHEWSYTCMPPVISWRVQGTLTCTLMTLLLGAWGKLCVVSFQLVRFVCACTMTTSKTPAGCQRSLLRSSEHQSCTWTLHFLISTFSLRWIMGQDVTAFYCTRRANCNKRFADWGSWFVYTVRSPYCRRWPPVWAPIIAFVSAPTGPKCGAD